MQKPILWGLLALSGFCFVGAMTVPALTFEKVCGGGDPVGLSQVPVGTVDVWVGGRILLMGIIGMIFVPHLSFGWLANLFYSAAFLSVVIRRAKLAIGLAIAGLIIGVSGTLWTETHGLPADEAGYCYLYLNQLNLGFWLWVAAQGIVISSAFATQRR